MADALVPEWAAPANVRALQTLRGGGVSEAPWNSFNLGEHVGDDPGHVAVNRGRLRQLLPAEPRWLAQVHGIAAVDADSCANFPLPVADAGFARRAGTICAVMTADCLPVLLCDRAGTVVAAAHAGWRGLAAGVLEEVIARMAVPPAQLLAWMGPAIGPQAFEVGDEVRAAFIARDSGAGEAFAPHGSGKWLADIYRLASRRLRAAGVAEISGGGACTVGEPGRYFSYRRDGVTGRMATLIWLEREAAGR